VDVSELVRSAQRGNLGAFAELVRRYQGMAVAYAYALLRDVHLAQDATQEAFVAAFFALDQLDEPAAFPGWLRRVVRTHCGRMTRRRQLEAVPLEHAERIAADVDPPERCAERRDERSQILRAVADLPRAHREVLTLYYVRDHSQREIAAFLGLPVTTVNARLAAARTALRNRVLALVGEALREGALPEDFPDRVAGTIGDWRRVREAHRFEAWPRVLPGRLPTVSPNGFEPHAGPDRCPCRALVWPCPRCARLEGVDPASPLAANGR
jgi:RNA polymerase sigma factor (sigma-70 family)